MSPNPTNPPRRSLRWLTLGGLLALALFSQRAVAQPNDTLFATAGSPKFKVGPVPPSLPFRYVLWIQGVKITVEIKDMDAKKGTETFAQASQRKAAQIVAEINKGICVTGAYIRAEA